MTFFINALRAYYSDWSILPLKGCHLPDEHSHGNDFDQLMNNRQAQGSALNHHPFWC